jgi:Cu-processing system ATP-binding protein
MSETREAPSRTLVLPHHVIDVVGVSKRFRRVIAVDQVSFGVKAGRITAILGPNAAGKSTIIKTMLGLVRPDTGHITIDGTAVNGAPEYRTRLGYMPQSACFPDNLTGREVMAMLQDLRAGSPVDLELFDELGLTPELDRPVRTLSGGTRQKLNAAVAFLFRPSVLILDEPTAGLDPIASGVLKRKILRARRDGASVILTSHVLAEVEELAEEIVFLLEGTIAFAGSVQDLKRSTGQERLESAVERLMLGRAS